MTGMHAKTYTVTDAIPWLTPATRKWIYGIISAVIVLLTIYGVLTDNTAPAWLGLASAIVGNSIAFVNVPTARDENTIQPQQPDIAP
ncbi:MAG: hypothetical protein SOS98_03795 [Varibaculum sp.]|nr:hypothetical protein [Varibaculum sp.]